MQIYVLDKSFISKILIDSFISFIWTDRYYEAGDFQLELLATDELVRDIRYEDYLYIRESEHMMIIETIEIMTNYESGDRIILTGRSLESILDRRVIWNKTKITGNLQNGIFRILNDNFINANDKARNIPGFSYRRSADPSIKDLTIDLDLFGENVYEFITEICMTFQIGFKILPVDGGFEFSLYSGVNRTYAQKNLPWVVFSPQFENLISTDYIESRANLKNAALVYNNNNDVDTMVSVISSTYKYANLGRREIFVEASGRSEQINKDDFGKPEDRVDIKDYQVYEAWYFDRQGYEEMVEKYGEDSIIVGDKSLYMEYDWVFKPGGEEEYKKALEEAQKEIDKEYEEAVANANNVYLSSLRQTGKNELSNYDIVSSFDGELQYLNQYIYGRDFFMGDLVQFRNKYGLEGVSRIIEVIHSQDETGEHKYPTFSGV